MYGKRIIISLILLALAAIACSNFTKLPTNYDNTEAAALSAQAGQDLFAQLDCKTCHVLGAGHVAPSLNGLFSGTVSLENGDSVIADENYIRKSILFPHEKVVAGYSPVMPTFEGRITEDQLTLLVDYIKSLE